MAVNLSPVGGVAAQFFDNSGQVLTGGKLYTYLAGTTTPAPTYTTNSGISANSNPIILNAAGRVADSGEIWLTDGINYKFVLKDSNDVQIAVWDNISGINSNFVNYTLQEQTFTATQGQTVFTLTGGIQYTPNTSNLAVYVNGSKQVAGINYTETSSTVFTFLTGLNVGDIVDALTAIPVATNVISSNNVSYNQGGTGAVTTNVQTKLQQTVSVKDFGAKGDGITDDTTAIQNAFNSGAKAIIFPNAIYKINSILTVSPSILIDFNGSTIDASSITSGTIFTMVGSGPSYDQQTPWMNGYIKGNTQPNVTVFSISNSVGKAFNDMHFDFFNNIWTIGSNCWLVSFNGGLAKTAGAGSTAVGTFFNIPSGLTTAGESIRFNNFTFAGFATVFSCQTHNFDLSCTNCSFDYNQTIYYSTNQLNLDLFGCHIESNWNGGPWFTSTSAATQFANINISGGIIAMYAANYPYVMFTMGSITNNVNLQNVYLDGFQNYTPPVTNRVLVTGAGYVSYFGLNCTGWYNMPVISGNLRDPNQTLNYISDWKLGTSRTPSTNDGNVVLTTGVGPNSNNAITLVPGTATTGFCGVYRQIYQIGSFGDGGSSLIVVRFKYKLAAGTAYYTSNDGNYLRILYITTDYSGATIDYSQAFVTGTISDNNWHYATSQFITQKNASCTVYIEAHNLSGGANSPTFYVSECDLEVIT